MNKSDKAKARLNKERNINEAILWLKEHNVKIPEKQDVSHLLENDLCVERDIENWLKGMLCRIEEYKKLGFYSFNADWGNDEYFDLCALGPQTDSDYLKILNKLIKDEENKERLMEQEKELYLKLKQKYEGRINE